MTDEPFYVTTPIYYVNDEPHLGHAYTTILADALARYARLRGQGTFFLTGTDEHGQKVQEAAQQRGVPSLQLADEMAGRFQHTWDKLHVAHDDFIRTTQPRHVCVVQTVLQALWDKGEIYFDEYEGWYCVPDERFWTEKDLVRGNCPDCGRPVQRLAEANYFFRMSAYHEWLVDYIRDHPDFIQPPSRRNEVLGFLRQPLADFCISRPASRLSWGIPLPFAPDYVTYVWFDALLNYVTAAGYLAQEARFRQLWPQALHVIGKDVLITHAVYWPTMLRAAGLPPPRTILAHGWWIAGGAKMSKSVGNVLKPLDLAQLYGVDAFRYFLLREATPGRDTSFSEAALRQRYHGDLANDLGNLLRRLLSMTRRYCDGRIPEAGRLTAADEALRRCCLALPAAALSSAASFAVSEALAQTMATVGEINRYLEDSAPWHQAKAGAAERVNTILYTGLEALRLCSLLLWPVLPERMATTWQRLGWQPPPALHAGLSWGLLKPGTRVGSGSPLFPRLEEDG
jgi:methionyl-tRNA synthetase